MNVFLVISIEDNVEKYYHDFDSAYEDYEVIKKMCDKVKLLIVGGWFNDKETVDLYLIYRRLCQNINYMIDVNDELLKRNNSPVDKSILDENIEIVSGVFEQLKKCELDIKYGEFDHLDTVYHEGDVLKEDFSFLTQELIDELNDTYVKFINNVYGYGGILHSEEFHNRVINHLSTCDPFNKKYGQKGTISKMYDDDIIPDSLFPDIDN